MLRALSPACVALGLMMSAQCVPMLFVAAAGAADLTGKFVYDGNVPAPVPVVGPKVVADFPGLALNYEDLVVDPNTKGIAWVAVYIKDDVFPVTAAATAAAPPNVVVNNKNGQFQPHLTALWVGKQTLEFQNADAVTHNSNFNLAGVNPLLPPNFKMPIPVAGTKLLPQEINCTIHPWMRAYVVARHHPYVGFSDAGGTFTIRGLPAGVEIEFQAWHERAGYLSIAKWPKGRFKMTLTDGVNDLGEIKVPPAVLN